MKKILIIILLFPSFSFAQIPETNYVNIIQNFISNQMRLQEQEKLIEIYKKTSGLMKELSAAKIEVSNNGFSNWAIRTNQSKADIQNNEMLQKSSPGIDFCSAMAPLSMTNPCNSGNYLKHLYLGNRSYGSGDAPVKRPGQINIEDRNKEIIKNALASRPSYFSSRSNGDAPTNELSISIEPLGLMSDKKEYLTVSEDDALKMIDYIDLIAPPYIYTPEMIRNSMSDEKYKVVYMKEQAMREVPRTILQSHLSNRVGGNTGISKQSSYQEFSDTYYSGDDYKETIAHKISTSNLAIPDAVLRNIVMIKTFRLNMALQQYRSSLNIEHVNAIKLQRLLDE